MDAMIKRRDEDIKKLRELAKAYPGIVEITGVLGNPPNMINLQLNIPTAKNTSYPREVQKSTSLTINLPVKYPFKDGGEPKMTINSPIWNPNVYSNGIICHGAKWLPTEGLNLLVIWVMKLLSFDPGVINTKSPANAEAARWYTSVIGSNIFPTISLDSLKVKEKPKLTWNNL